MERVDSITTGAAHWFAGSILIVAAIVVSTPLAADTLVLRNGLRIFGKVIQQSPTHLTIRTPRGRKTLRKKYIRSVKYESYDEALKKRQDYRRRVRAARRKRALAARRRRAAARRKAETEARARLDREAQARSARELARAAAIKEANSRRAETERIRREQEALRKRETERLRRESERKQKEEQEAAKRAELLAGAKERAARLKLMRQAVKEGGMDKPDEPIEYWDFAWRSLVLPGWGHLSIGKKIPGLFYSITTGAAILWLSQTRSAALSAEKNNRTQIELYGFAVLSPAGIAVTTAEQRNALSAAVYSQRRGSYDSRVDLYNRGLVMLGVAYGLQFLHIIYDGFRWESGELITDEDRRDAAEVSKTSRWSGDLFFEPAPARDSRSVGIRGRIVYTLVF